MNPAAEEKLGTLKISDDVVAICAMNAALRGKGVAGLSGAFADSISRNLFGKDPLHKGIKVNQGEDGISIDIYIVVEYGVKIPEVAWDVQESVKTEVEAMTDTAVKAVNIHVQGVHFTDEEDR
jgi:uncharacterized alkaline shock family protein YloU